MIILAYRNIKSMRTTETEPVNNYRKILQDLPQHVQLVAVSKTHPPEVIQQVYDAGQRVFGENKVQELTEKAPKLPPDIQWHLIGHLQTNKVKYIAEFIDTIQSVDSEKILLEISRQATKYNRTIKVYLQIKIAAEETKYGLTKQEAQQLFRQYMEGNYPNVEITGLMGMASFTDDTDQIRTEFNTLKEIFDEFSLMKPLQTLSMGMSGDYQIAIACGSNSVRVGSAIFGSRQYDL